MRRIRSGHQLWTSAEVGREGHSFAAVDVLLRPLWPISFPVRAHGAQPLSTGDIDMRHSRSTLVIALLLSVAACGQGTTEPDALAAESESVSVPAPSYDVGAEGGAAVGSGGEGSFDGTQGDSTTIVPGDGGNRGAQWGGGQ
jgi:hypothetical protein